MRCFQDDTSFFFKRWSGAKTKKKRNEKINIVKPLESQAPLIYIHAL
jgi:protein gp37